LNPRFVAALIKGVTIKPSSYQVQRRLRLCGVRPINNIVDATNYAMLEVGQPLHAFDYDVLVSRAAPKTPTLITRTATAGETLKTLDGVERKLDDFTILVCDEKGALGLGGVMGGLESEVSDKTTSVLLEGAAWEFINIRKTMQAQKLSSEAGYRFSRGVHPAMTARGVKRGIELMRQWGGGTVAHGLVEAIAKPTPSVSVEITPAEVTRILGIQLSTADIVRILESLQFTCEVQSQITNQQSTIHVTVPDHRLDIGAGVVGQADVIEEIARIYGYERIPETQLADDLPPQRRNLSLEVEEQARDILVNAGLQEVLTYSLTTPERERRTLSPNTPADERPYVTLLNPIASDRTSMRHSLLASVLEIAAANVRLSERLALFEIAPVYIVEEEESLPQEPRRLAVVLTGLREPQSWQAGQSTPMDFFEVKGVIESLLDGLHIAEVSYAPGQHPTFLPGRTAELKLNGQSAGWLGELHPRVREQYDLPNQAVLAADLDFEILAAQMNERYPVRAVPEFPPVKEDLALVLDEAVPAANVEAAIRSAGGNLLTGLTLFDVYRDEKLGAGKKSLAFSLTYQAPDRTLTDSDVAKVRTKIVKKLQDELGASLRS
jgi:phenylalanyl-tRNA synthetase beta chain